METKFNNKNGNLSKYSFACGYIDKKNSSTNWKQMYMEHSMFVVRSGKLNEQYEVWEKFESNELTKARKYYNSIKL